MFIPPVLSLKGKTASDKIINISNILIDIAVFKILIMEPNSLFSIIIRSFEPLSSLLLRSPLSSLLCPLSSLLCPLSFFLSLFSLLSSLVSPLPSSTQPEGVRAGQPPRAYWQRSLHKHFSNDGAHASLFASNARRPYEGVQAALMEAFLQTRA